MTMYVDDDSLYETLRFLVPHLLDRKGLIALAAGVNRQFARVICGLFRNKSPLIVPSHVLYHRYAADDDAERVERLEVEMASGITVSALRLADGRQERRLLTEWCKEVSLFLNEAEHSKDVSEKYLDPIEWRIEPDELIDQGEPIIHLLTSDELIDQTTVVSSPNDELDFYRLPGYMRFHRATFTFDDAPPSTYKDEHEAAAAASGCPTSFFSTAAWGALRAVRVFHRSGHRWTLRQMLESAFGRVVFGVCRDVYIVQAYSSTREEWPKPVEFLPALTLAPFSACRKVIVHVEDALPDETALLELFFNSEAPLTSIVWTLTRYRVEVPSNDAAFVDIDAYARKLTDRAREMFRERGKSITSRRHFARLSVLMCVNALPSDKEELDPPLWWTARTEREFLEACRLEPNRRERRWMIVAGRNRCRCVWASPKCALEDDVRQVSVELVMLTDDRPFSRWSNFYIHQASHNDALPAEQEAERLSRAIDEEKKNNDERSLERGRAIFPDTEDDMGIIE